PHDRATMESMSRCFAALKQCVHDLRKYYKAGPKEQIRFPYLCQISNLQWKWICQLHPQKQVWLVEIENQQKAVVKFSELLKGPSLQALQICADNKLAPKLLAHGFSGRWCVTVSQYVDGDTIDVHLQQLTRKKERAALL